MPAGFIHFNNHVVSNNNKNKNVLPVVSPLLKKPISSNNSLVFYKAGSLGSHSISGVRNSRAVARRT